MFTGIITASGDLVLVDRRKGLIRWTVESPYELATVTLGASICHSGCCLTVVDMSAAGPGRMRHVVEIAAESIAKTNLAGFEQGAVVNLERSLKAGDELGGHFVSGHVDGVGEILSVTQDGEGWRLKVKAPDELSHLIAPKGSITIDGVSLTVNEVEGTVFGVLIIPHTWTVTTLGEVKPGAKVNLEVDPFARYVARVLEGQALKRG